jgi:hypothetical protein
VSQPFTLRTAFSRSLVGSISACACATLIVILAALSLSATVRRSSSAEFLNVFGSSRTHARAVGSLGWSSKKVSAASRPRRRAIFCSLPLPVIAAHVRAGTFAKALHQSRRSVRAASRIASEAVAKPPTPAPPRTHGCSSGIFPWAFVSHRAASRARRCTGKRVSK